VTPFLGPVEIWCKWQSHALVVADLTVVRTRKLRWLRKFDTTDREPIEIPLAEDEAPADRRPLPAIGCNVEFTRVELDTDQVWWTLGFEAFGDLWSVERAMRGTLSTMASRSAPSACSGELLSYPAWLSKYVARAQ
jgi:hypothetical protein